MTDDQDVPLGSGAPHDAGVDDDGPSESEMGEPIGLLADHGVPPSTGFGGRVHRSIERRLLAADVTRLGVLGPLATLMELLRALFESLGATRPRHDEED